MPQETELTTLLIDRVEARRQEIARSLAHTVIQATDIPTGQRLFDVHQPTFVLMDGALLERDAAEVIATFKHDGVQVFAFCGNNETIINRLLDAGIDDCFRLPLNMRLIQRRLTSMTAIRQTAQREGERQLQQVEDNYQRLFNSANDAILIVDIFSGEIVDANRRAVRWLGYAQDELIGKTYKDIEFVDGTDNGKTIHNISTKGQYIYEQNFISKQNDLLHGEVSTRLFIYEGRRTLLNFIRDVGPRKVIESAEHQQRVLAEALIEGAAALNSTLEPQAVVNRILEQVTKVFPASMANVMLVDEAQKDTVFIAGAVGYNQTYTIDRALRLSIETTPNLKAMRYTHEPMAIVDLPHDENWNHNVPSAQWIQSYLGAPMIADGQVIGFINLDHPISFAFDAQQAQSLMAFANQASIAIQNAHLHANIVRYTETLEQRVEERTAELRRANISLRDQIVERQQIEASLDEERNLLRTLIDRLPNEVFIEDDEGYIVTANKTLLHNAGVNQAKSLHHNAIMHRYPADIQKTLADLQHRVVAHGETIQNYEITYLDPVRGEPQWVLITRLPLRNKYDRVVGMIGINRDITEIKRVQNHLADVVRGASCVLWQASAYVVDDDKTEWDLQVIDEDAAQSFLPLNTSPTVSYAKAWEDAIVPEDYDALKKSTDVYILSGRKSYAVEFRCLDAEKRLRWLREEVKITQIDNHTYHLVGVATDISEIKGAEFALQRTNELLEHRVRERTVELTHANAVLREQIQERERAEQAEREQRKLAEALRDVALTLSKTLELTDVLDLILERVMQFLPQQSFGGISLIEDMLHVRVIRYHIYNKGEEMVRAFSNDKYALDQTPLFSEVMQTRQAIVLADAQLDNRWRNWTGMEWVRSFLTVPIMVDNRVIGFLSVASKDAEVFSEESADQIQAFSSQAGIAIQNARLFSEVQQHASELQKRVAERTQQLEAERAQLQIILDGMVEGVVYTSFSGQILYVNKALVNMSGYDEITWLTQPAIWEVIYTGDETFEDFSADYEARLMAQGQYRRRSKMRQRDGSVIDIEVMTTLVRDQNQSLIGSVTVLRDISAEKRLEEQKARFIANASHELRTPITNLKTRLYLLRKKPETLERHLPVLENVTNRMRQLVEDLLDVSRFEHGVIMLERDLVDVASLVHSVVSVQQQEAENRQQQLIIKLPDAPLTLFADEARMQQVLTNLVTNAINYTPERGTITVQVEQTTVDNVDMVVFHVRDTGVGIPAKLQREIFQPFFRASELNTGIGLGLSITREIIELHSGKITVESEEGAGTCFSVYIPRLKEDTTL